jgi:hypothetical protein
MAFPGQQQQANQQMHMQQPPYNDSILTITEKSCADPYVLFDKGTYYMVSSRAVPDEKTHADLCRHGRLVARLRSGRRKVCSILRRGARRT